MEMIMQPGKIRQYHIGLPAKLLFMRPLVVLNQIMGFTWGSFFKKLMILGFTLRKNLIEPW